LSGTRGFSAAGARAHIPINYFKKGGHTAYDPDDFGDIVEVIKGTFNPNLTDERKFISTLSRWERIRLNTYRLGGLA
jgi:hypothetical protein